MCRKAGLRGGQVFNVMRQSMLLNEGALISIERRTTRLEHGFVGTDIASNGDAETAAATDASDAVTETAAAAVTDTTDTQ